MATEPIGGGDLAIRLERATNGYDRSWKTVDEGLYAWVRLPLSSPPPPKLPPTKGVPP